MLVQRLRRWPNITSATSSRVVLAGRLCDRADDVISVTSLVAPLSCCAVLREVTITEFVLFSVYVCLVNG